MASAGISFLIKVAEVAFVYQNTKKKKAWEVRSSKDKITSTAGRTVVNT